MANKINVENVVAKLLGQAEEGEKLIRLHGDTSFEPIGNFNQVKSLVNDIHERSYDFSTPWSNMAVTHDYSNLYLSVNRTGDEVYSFSNNGLLALCNTVGVPTGYIKKCMAGEKFGLACGNLNDWIDTMPRDKEMHLRTTDDRLYGLLSNKYVKFDDHEVLQATEEILAPYHEYAVQNYIATPEIMKARIISREKININGEELSFGFDIKNSRVGRASCEIAILIFRWICGNGVIFGGGKGFMFAKRHVAINREQFVTGFAEMLDQSPDAIKYIKSAVEASQGLRLNSENIQNLINKFKADNVSRNAAGRVEQMMDEKYDRTLWGMSQAITELAQDYNFETREKMEEFAGKILLAKAV